jgi:hypothetical protein
MQTPSHGSLYNFSPLRLDLFLGNFILTFMASDSAGSKDIRTT